MIKVAAKVADTALTTTNQNHNPPPEPNPPQNPPLHVLPTAVHPTAGAVADAAVTAPTVHPGTNNLLTHGNPIPLGVGLLHLGLTLPAHIPPHPLRILNNNNPASLAFVPPKPIMPPTSRPPTCLPN